MKPVNYLAVIICVCLIGCGLDPGRRYYKDGATVTLDTNGAEVGNSGATAATKADFKLQDFECDKDAKEKNSGVLSVQNYDKCMNGHGWVRVPSDPAYPVTTQDHKM